MEYHKPTSKPPPISPDDLPEECVPGWVHPTSRAYLTSRKLTKSEVEFWDLQYSDGGPFKNRIIIPVYDDAGKLVCYQGRSVDDQEPRYRTTGPKSLYKSWDSELASNIEAIVLVEGPFDLYSMYRAWPYSIATLGTMLSDPQLKDLRGVIKRTTPSKVIVWFDREATQEAFDLQLKLQPYVNTSVMIDLVHKDPGSMLTEEINELLNPYLE